MQRVDGRRRPVHRHAERGELLVKPARRSPGSAAWAPSPSSQSRRPTAPTRSGSGRSQTSEPSASAVGGNAEAAEEGPAGCGMGARWVGAPVPSRREGAVLPGVTPPRFRTPRPHGAAAARARGTPHRPGRSAPACHGGSSRPGRPAGTAAASGRRSPQARRRGRRALTSTKATVSPRRTTRADLTARGREAPGEGPVALEEEKGEGEPFGEMAAQPMPPSRRRRASAARAGSAVPAMAVSPRRAHRRDGRGRAPGHRPPGGGGRSPPPPGTRHP